MLSSRKYVPTQVGASVRGDRQRIENLDGSHAAIVMQADLNIQKSELSGSALQLE